MWCTRLDRDRKETSQMKKTTTNRATATAEPTVGTPPTGQDLANHAELGRQEQMKSDLAKVKAGDKRRKASITDRRYAVSCQRDVCKYPRFFLNFHLDTFLISDLPHFPVFVHRFLSYRCAGLTSLDSLFSKSAS